MQLTRFSDKLIPLTLAAGLLTPPLAYSDIDAFSGIYASPVNLRTAKYIKLVDCDEVAIFHNKFKAIDFINKWKIETAFLSSPEMIVSDGNFRALVNMGENAVPFILDDIEKNPSTLVWALNMIYKRKITNKPCVSITEACKLWVKELKK